MTGAFAHATGPRPQRDDVAGSSEVLEAGGWGGQRAAGEGAVLRGDPGGHRWVAGVDGDGVGSALGVCVVSYHLREGEVVGNGGSDGGAD